MQNSDLMADERTIVIASTFTPDPVGDTIRYWLDCLELRGRIVFAPQNQVFQTLLDPAMCFGAGSALNVVMLRWQDLVPGEGLQDAPWSDIGDALRSSSLKTKVSHLVVCCPSASAAESPEKQQLYSEWDNQLAEKLREFSNIHIVPTELLQSLYPASPVYDFYGERFAAMPFSSAMYAAIATAIARTFHMLTADPYKAIVVDCDDTLWLGACGEDGPEGIVIDAPRLALLEFLIAQSRQGVLIVLCSKNNPEDVEAVFQARAELQPLMEHLACRRVNWDAKAENLLSIAEELGIGTESFIFIDDNPVECEAMRRQLPEVLTLQLPPDPNKIPQWLQRVWAFDRRFATAEDRHRSAMYRHNRQRQELRKSSNSLEDFLANLDLKITRVPLVEACLPRASQLTFRVNQFNLTTIRRTETEIDALLRQGALNGFLVDARDRYGEYGLVGLVLYTLSGNELRLDTLLLSCRALGRGVEHRIVADLATIAQSAGLEFVELRLVPTAKNQPAREFLSTSFGPYGRQCESYLEYRVPIDIALTIRHRPYREEAVVDRGQIAVPVTSKNSAASAIRAQNLAHMAAQPFDADGLLSDIRHWRTKDSGAGATSVPARTEMEKMLVELWMEVLGLEKVGVHDNFFALGGDSLKMVRVIVTLYGHTGVEFPIAAFFEKPTIEAHAAKLSSILSG
ncbi:MAG TPA: HAD-IIIC family phosphatase [Terriglobales bacterium]|nr:HAD-IIIC family phosphatase [Terriglobales bacterium]